MRHRQQKHMFGALLALQSEGSMKKARLPVAMK